METRGELVVRFEDMLREMRNKVRGKEVGKQFWMERGMKQGCPLSPEMFTLLMVEEMR